MARRNVLTRVGIPRARGRVSSWSTGPGGTTATQISATSAVLVGSGSTPTIPLTVLRLRGELLIHLDTVGSAGDGYRGAFGVGIASLPAFTAGINSLPTPITEDADENWLYHTYFAVTSPTATLADQTGSTFFRMTIDSKAMRKADVDKVFYAAIEVVETGAAVMTCSFDSRFLNLIG